MRRAPPAPALVKENDPVTARIERSAGTAFAAGSRPAVDDERGLSVRIAARLPVDVVAVAHLEHSVVVRLARRVTIDHALRFPYRASSSLSPMTAEQLSTDVILRDGSTLRLRPPRRDDADALLDLFRSLSERSLYLRFHGVPEPRLTADRAVPRARLGRARGAAGGARGRRRRARRRASPTTCASATLPSPSRRSRSPTTTRAAGSARGCSSSSPPVPPSMESSASSRRCCRTTATCWASSSRPVSSSRASSKAASSRCSSRSPRPRATASGSTSATTRRSGASLRPFFEPSSVAVIGASRRRGSIGGELFRNILAGDFQGAAHPVNRDGEAVAGVRGYSSIAEIPERGRPGRHQPAGGRGAGGGRGGAPQGRARRS